jgi:hypothetical protein
MKISMTCCVCVALTCGLAACGGSQSEPNTPDDGPIESAGESVDEAADAVEESAEGADDDTGDAVGEAGEAVDEETEDEE